MYACGGGSVPSGILNPDRMTALLTEIHIADGSMYSAMQVPDSLYKYGTARYLVVFKSFQTDSVQFKNSMKYYASRPDQLEKIYDQVTSNLQHKSDSLNKISEQQMARDNKRRTDSIKRLPKQPPVQAKPVVNPPVQPPGKPFMNKKFAPAKKKRNADPI